MIKSLTGTWMASQSSSSILSGGYMTLAESKGGLSGSGTLVVIFSMPGSFTTFKVKGTVKGTSVCLKYDDGLAKGTLTGSIVDDNHFSVSGTLSGFYGKVNFSCRRISISYPNEITGVWNGKFGSDSQDITLYISQLSGGNVTGIVETTHSWIISKGSGVTYPTFSVLISMPNLSYGDSTFSGSVTSTDGLTAALSGTLDSGGNFNLTRSS